MAAADLVLMGLGQARPCTSRSKRRRARRVASTTPCRPFQPHDTTPHHTAPHHTLPFFSLFLLIPQSATATCSRAANDEGNASFLLAVGSLHIPQPHGTERTRLCCCVPALCIFL